MAGLANELAGLAERILPMVPNTAEWQDLQNALGNIITILRSHSSREQLAALKQLLPLLWRVFRQLNRYFKVVNTYEIAETLSRHFLIKDNLRVKIEELLEETKMKITEVKNDIESFAMHLDKALNNAINGQTASCFSFVYFAFKINRISAKLETCEKRLMTTRQLIDDLGQSVNSKYWLAIIIQYIGFIVGTVFTATGNLPIGGACLAAATTSRKAAQSLNAYAPKVQALQIEQQQLELQLAECSAHFRAERFNFLQFGLKNAFFFVLVLAVAFFVVGTEANFAFFAIVTLYMVIKSAKTKGLARLWYYVGLGLAILFVTMEIQGYRGLILFNFFVTMMTAAHLLGF